MCKRNCHISSALQVRPWRWFDTKMPSYPYRKSPGGDKTILRPSYLHDRISFTAQMTSLGSLSQWKDANKCCICAVKTFLDNLGFKHREQHWHSINIIQMLWGTGHHQKSNICETDCWLRATISKFIKNCSGRKPFIRLQHSWQTRNPQISSITTTTEFNATSSHRVLMVWMCLWWEYQDKNVLKSYFMQNLELHETWLPISQFSMASSTHVFLTVYMVLKRNPTSYLWTWMINHIPQHAVVMLWWCNYSSMKLQTHLRLSIYCIVYVLWEVHVDTTSYLDAHGWLITSHRTLWWCCGGVIAHPCLPNEDILVSVQSPIDFSLFCELLY